MRRLNNSYGLKCPVHVWDSGVNIEPEAWEQINNTASLRHLIWPHIAVMPDAHWGNGSTVGTVISSRETLIPAAVSIDLGCGMIAQRTSLSTKDLPDNLKEIRSLIEQYIPHGRTHNGKQGVDKGSNIEIPTDVLPQWSTLVYRYRMLTEKHPKIGTWGDPKTHLGTLGTGNHFIELCTDVNEDIWIMLHSGSRGIGARIGHYFISKAKECMEKYKFKVPDKNLSYLRQDLEPELFNDYVDALSWAQDFAARNRRLMMAKVIRALSVSLEMPIHEIEDRTVQAINCHHNYVARETYRNTKVWITRKGAIRAGLGELGIIPGNMGAKSYIVKGKAGSSSLWSCSHGAGRSMSRRQAKEVFTLEDHIKATEGVECRKDEDVLDETPGAYKNLDAVMNAQKDLVEIVHELKQILCVKG